LPHRTQLIRNPDGKLGFDFAPRSFRGGVAHWTAESEKAYPHMPDDFDAKRTLLRQQFLEEQKKMQGKLPFRGNNPTPTFWEKRSDADDPKLLAARAEAHSEARDGQERKEAEGDKQSARPAYNPYTKDVGPHQCATMCIRGGTKYERV
jgi:hypothetical protein